MPEYFRGSKDYSHKAAWLRLPEIRKILKDLHPHWQVKKMKAGSLRYLYQEEFRI